ncbi:MAG: hypothetical protein NE330_14260 [Lentisphaeraceae bacterium]|nr:hypothetical protein [Lentisphaeraceae bacterium]
MAKLRVLFFGNHDVGIEALDVLLTKVDISGVVGHPPDSEDGVVYKSLIEWADSKKLENIRSTANSPELRDWLKSKSYDLIWVTDYRYIIPDYIFETASLGAINLHPSLLPEYRGRAPINWAIINGEKELGLTAHFIDEGVDSGDIITQRQYHLSADEDVQDALNKLYPLYRQITGEVIDYLNEGDVPRLKQKVESQPVYPGRKAEDGRIDWTQKAEDIQNLIRAVAPPYPGAFCFLNERKIFIYKASIVVSSFETEPGIIAKFEGENIFVSTGCGALKLVDFEPSDCFESGMKFQ